MNKPAGTMRLVERMTLAPGTCLFCGCGNTPDGQTGEIGPFIDTAADVNWGDSVYVCLDCATILGSLADMITADDKKELERSIKRRDKKIHELESVIDELRLRIRSAVRRARALEEVAS